MKTFITRAEALSRYKLKENELNDLIEGDRVTCLILEDGEREEMIFYDDDLAAYRAERDITPANFAHLRGNLLGFGEAARAHRLNQVTISRWVKQGQLTVKGRDGQKKLIDEADVAYLAALGRAKNIRPGKKVFSS